MYTCVSDDYLSPLIMPLCRPLSRRVPSADSVTRVRDVWSLKITKAFLGRRLPSTLRRDTLPKGGETDERQFLLGLEIYHRQREGNVPSGHDLEGTRQHPPPRSLQPPPPPGWAAPLPTPTWSVIASPAACCRRREACQCQHTAIRSTQLPAR